MSNHKRFDDKAGDKSKDIDWEARALAAEAALVDSGSVIAEQRAAVAELAATAEHEATIKAGLLDSIEERDATIKGLYAMLDAAASDAREAAAVAAAVAAADAAGTACLICGRTDTTTAEKHGRVFIDCPVHGRQVAAQEATSW